MPVPYPETLTISGSYAVDIQLFSVKKAFSEPQEHSLQKKTVCLST
jgi:hypothetical protein